MYYICVPKRVLRLQVKILPCTQTCCRRAAREPIKTHRAPTCYNIHFFVVVGRTSRTKTRYRRVTRGSGPGVGRSGPAASLGPIPTSTAPRRRRPWRRSAPAAAPWRRGRVRPPASGRPRPPSGPRSRSLWTTGSGRRTRTPRGPRTRTPPSPGRKCVSGSRGTAAVRARLRAADAKTGNE